MKEVIDFFRRLHDDNTREWFDAHRAEWTRVKGRFADFTGQLIGGIASFDPEVRGLRPQDCTYRIARDTRFSPDKSPYKTYIGAYIAPKGKKSGFAGYYFHIEPCCDSLVCCNLLSAGAVCIEPTVLRSIREEVLDNGAQIEAAIRKAKGFRLCERQQAQAGPDGIPGRQPLCRDAEAEGFLPRTAHRRGVPARTRSAGTHRRAVPPHAAVHRHSEPGDPLRPRRDAVT